MLDNNLIQSTSSWPFVEIRKLLKDRKDIIKKKPLNIANSKIYRFVILWCLFSPLVWSIPNMPSFITLVLKRYIEDSANPVHKNYDDYKKYPDQLFNHFDAVINDGNNKLTNDKKYLTHHL